MKKSIWMMSMLGASVLLGCYGTEGRSSVASDAGASVGNLSLDDDDDEGVEAEEGDGEEQEQDVSLADVPQAAKDAAIAAVPGLSLSEAEKEGADAYCLHGHAGGVFYEVEVTSAGKVIDIESGEEEDE
jgi:hypothetical protein